MYPLIIVFSIQFQRHEKREYLNPKRSKRQCVRDARAVLLLVCLCLWLCMCEWHIFVLSSSTPSTSAHFDMQIEWRIFPMYSDKFINNLYGINRTKRTDERTNSHHPTYNAQKYTQCYNEWVVCQKTDLSIVFGRLFVR